jgi:hypothetical protein
VHNTVGDENIRSDDAGTVHENLSISNGNGQVCAVDSLERSSIGQTAAVTDSSGNDVVSKDAADLLDGEVGKTRANSLESGVVGCKNGDIFGSVDSLDEVGSGEGTSEGRKTSSDGSAGGRVGNSEDSVNDVDDSAGEGNILENINCRSRAQCTEVLTALETDEFFASPLKMETPPLRVFASTT